MSQRHGSNFRSKHPIGAKVADNILHALRPRIRKGKITCANAHALAREIKVPPQQVGMAIDLYEARIVVCQLGLFGVSPSAKIDPATTPLPMGLEQAILTASKDKTITCLRAWQIGQTYGATRRQVGHICNNMKVKISHCQLGAF